MNLKEQLGLIVCAAVSCGAWPAMTQAAIEYTITDLGTLGGTPILSQGFGINDNGQVTGNSNTTGPYHAFLYDGTIHDLGSLGGPNRNSTGRGINSAGDVTGWSETDAGSPVHAFAYDGTLHDLGTLGGEYTEGIGINNLGHVTGYSSTVGYDPYHAYLYDGTMHDLGTLGGANSYGNGINNSGVVTGYSYTSGGSDNHAFLWTPFVTNGDSGTMQDLGTLGGTRSYGIGINDGGKVTGFSELAGDASTHAFLYDGTLHDLGTLGGVNSYGQDVNNFGQIVGYSEKDGDVAAHAFLYAGDTGMVDLNSLVSPLAGWELWYAWSINNAGQIAGDGLIDGEQHAFLLTPVPEPSSFVMLGTAAILANTGRFWTVKKRRPQPI